MPTTHILPKGFSYLHDPRIILSINYAGNDNFLGRPVASYFAKVCILTTKAKDALIKVQDALDAYQQGYRLRIFDAYRPTTAVADFQAWAKDPHDKKMKALCYPDFDKLALFEQGYISRQSAHSRGSTVDLTITLPNPRDPKVPIDLDMGTAIDFFSEKSHTFSDAISKLAKKNRELLVDVMAAQGFLNYEKEWWHYTLKNEPFPDTYFDFPIQEGMDYL